MHQSLRRHVVVVLRCLRLQADPGAFWAVRILDHQAPIVLDTCTGMLSIPSWTGHKKILHVKPNATGRQGGAYILRALQTERVYGRYNQTYSGTGKPLLLAGPSLALDVANMRCS